MNTDRFKNFDPDVRRLVLAFERGGEGVWMDVDELTVVADYYLEVRDVEGLEAAVSKGERIYPHNGDAKVVVMDYAVQHFVLFIAAFIANYYNSPDYF